MRKILVLLSLLNVTCQNSSKRMDVYIISQKKINVSAVSGLEIYGDKLLMISDNTEGLSVCDLSGKILETISLEKSTSPIQIIEKKQKSDYEACTIISKENSDYLLLIGSGSKKVKRNKAKLISLSGNENMKNYDLGKLYSFIRIKSGFELEDFNLEALAFFDNKLYFFNRGTNEIFVFKKSSFFDFLKDEKNEIKFKRYKMILEPINDFYTGVSGATISEDGVVFITASAEKTEDWYDDGEIVGSSVGWFHISEMQSEFHVKTKVLKKNGLNLKSKIESVAVHSIDQNKAKLFLVSDNDGQDSELFELDVFLQ